MTRRITRAKQQIKDSGIPFRLPALQERTERLAAVLHVLYLIFTEGYAATSGPSAASRRAGHRGDPAHPDCPRTLARERGGCRALGADVAY